MKQKSLLTKFREIRYSMRARRILREEKAKQFRREAGIIDQKEYQQASLEEKKKLLGLRYSPFDDPMEYHESFCK